MQWRAGCRLPLPLLFFPSIQTLCSRLGEMHFPPQGLMMMMMMIRCGLCRVVWSDMSVFVAEGSDR